MEVVLAAGHHDFEETVLWRNPSADNFVDSRTQRGNSLRIDEYCPRAPRDGVRSVIDAWDHPSSILVVAT